MTERAEIFEVGPRDGLQNEKQPVPTAAKIALVDRLSRAGFKRIEVTSFVSPKWVPQMADAAEVLAGIKRSRGVRYAALTPNLRGLEGAIAARADEVAVFASASEGFSQKNINCSIAESFERFAPVLERARDFAMPVRGYISCVTDCPYDGPTAPASVARVAKKLRELGCYDISLGDTIGAGTPETVGAMLDAVLAEVPANRLAGHFHDTGGRALANVEEALKRGLRTFDSAIAGLGGCPYAPGAPGNVDTLSLAIRLSELGFATGLDLEKLRAIAQWIGSGGLWQEADAK